MREHARSNFDSPGRASATDHAATESGTEQPPRLRADFQAVATILGRNRWSRRYDVDLREVDLRGANLREVHLEMADLTGAHLERAKLTSAHLVATGLTGAHLEAAILTDVHLEAAILTDVHLRWADLTGANLEGVKGLTPAQVERVIGLSEATGVPPGLLRT